MSGLETLFYLVVFFGTFAWAWIFIARKLNSGGKNKAVQHFSGAVFGFCAASIVSIIVGLATGAIKPEPSADPVDKKPAEAKTIENQAQPAGTVAPAPAPARPKINISVSEEESLKAVADYKRWKLKITALHERINTALSISDPGDWGDFARRFKADLEAQQDQLSEVKSQQARWIIGPSLNAVRMMFHAAAFENEKDFNEASAYYKKSIKELQQLIDGISPDEIINGS